MFQREWFEAGSAVFEATTADPASFPPLNDRQAQRAWLAGFLASWSEWLDRQGLPLSDEQEAATLDDRLTRTLRDRPELLRQLRSYRLGSQSWSEH